MAVVTRFAPSPTGYLHIGGARTALFNWLYARHVGGKFQLRIEDTDRERSTPEAVAAILDGMRWLGLDWDGEPLMQFSRAARHAEVAKGLLAEGKAYHCYASQEELAEMREAARKAGKPIRYDGRWRDRPASDAPPGVNPVVRFKAPQSGETVIEDQVQGTVRVANEQLDDMVLLRADGTPTYMLAVVVDDHDMGVTHIVRGDDHLNNAFRQINLIRALGWAEPIYAHIPLIHGPDGAKLSKRHGALGVEAYRDMGYLPEALRNYLLRLGWGHGDAEIISDAQAVEWFTLEAIGRSASRFDFAKLANLNGHYMRQADNAYLVTAAAPFLEKLLGRSLSEADRDRLLALMPGLKDRAKTLVELADGAHSSFDRLVPDDKAMQLLDTDARAMLSALAPRLQALAAWDAATIEAAVRAFAEGAGLKLGKVAQPLRAAVTGRAVSPPIFDIVALLGRAETFERMAANAGVKG